MPTDIKGTIEDLTKRVADFRDAREWKQFHNPKDVALALNLEASEVLELFQWKSESEAKSVYATEALRDELADVLYWVLLMAHDAKIDLASALVSKLGKNEEKYPVEKSRGRAAKYTDL